MSEEFNNPVSSSVTISNLSSSNHSEIYSLVQAQQQTLHILNEKLNDLKVERNNLKNYLKTFRDENFFLEIQLLNERKKNRIFNQKTPELITSDVSLKDPNTPPSKNQIKYFEGGIACLNAMHEKRSLKKSLEDRDSNTESKVLKFDESASISILQHGASSNSFKKPANENCRENSREEVDDNVKDGTNDLEMADETGLAERTEFEPRPKTALLTLGERVIRKYAYDPMVVELYYEILQQSSGRCNMDLVKLD